MLENTRKDQILIRALAQTPDYINLPQKHHTIPVDVLPNASEEVLRVSVFYLISGGISFVAVFSFLIRNLIILEVVQ